VTESVAVILAKQSGIFQPYIYVLRQYEPCA
jgi:hypothetical protein